MKSLSSRSATRRALLGISAIGVTVFALHSTVASANSPTPTASATTGSAQVNPDGTKTVTVSGTWAFATQSGDCNLAKRAAGFAVDWNDPNQAGNLVGTLNSTTIKVGAAAATSRNPVDNAVHPTPVTSFPGAWGGCGTLNSSLGYSTGTWGPLSHTYAASTTGQVTICAVMYDVHLDANGGQPNSASQTVAGGSGNNGDNSVNNGSASVTGCATVNLSTTPTLTTNASGSVTVGGKISDTATLSGGNAPTGSITFNVYGPGDTTCSKSLATLASTSAVSGNGSYTSAQYTTTKVGTYRFIARYTGDGANSAVNTKCNDANESVTTTAPFITSQSLTPNDEAFLGQEATGTVVFKLFGPNFPSCGSTHPAFQQTVTVDPSTGTAETTNTTFIATTQGTWKWLVTYSGDSTHPAATSPCGFESFEISNDGS